MRNMIFTPEEQLQKHREYARMMFLRKIKPFEIKGYTKKKKLLSQDKDYIKLVEKENKAISLLNDMIDKLSELKQCRLDTIEAKKRYQILRQERVKYSKGFKV